MFVNTYEERIVFSLIVDVFFLNKVTEYFVMNVSDACRLHVAYIPTDNFNACKDRHNIVEIFRGLFNCADVIEECDKYDTAVFREEGE